MGLCQSRHRRPAERETLFPICSVSKQFTCAAILCEFGEAERLDGHLAALLPAFSGKLPTSRQLADNQSGLRDYWATTTLLGATPGQPFSREEGIALLASTRTRHFAPRTSYSYSSGNFRVLAEMAQHASGGDMEELYARHVWRAGRNADRMSRPGHGTYPEHVTGYEGSELVGYLPAQNNIYWLGDAGISACLDDMLAYEQWIDGTRNEPQGLYRRLSRHRASQTDQKHITGTASCSTV